MFVCSDEGIPDESFHSDVCLIRVDSMETKVISGVQFSSLPGSYIRPESERPRLCEVEECNDVPVIDLGCPDRSLVVKRIGDACRQYGFFQVLNLHLINYVLVQAQLS